MSEDDLEGAPFNEWFESEADFPDFSSVHPTPHMGVNLSPFSANTQHDWAQENEDIYKAVQWIQPPIRAIQRVTYR